MYKVLCGIYGVGATTVYQWYQNGIKSLDDVRDGKGGLVLSENQKVRVLSLDPFNVGRRPYSAEPSAHRSD